MSYHFHPSDLANVLCAIQMSEFGVAARERAESVSSASPTASTSSSAAASSSSQQSHIFPARTHQLSAGRAARAITRGISGLDALIRSFSDESVDAESQASTMNAPSVPEETPEERKKRIATEVARSAEEELQRYLSAGLKEIRDGEVFDIVFYWEVSINCVICMVCHCWYGTVIDKSYRAYKSNIHSSFASL